MNSLIKHTLIFLFSLLVAILNGYLFNFFNDKYFQYSSGENGLESFSPNTKFFLLICIAPLLETLLLNRLPNLTLRKLKVTNEFALIILPSVFFGLWHFYHPLYIAMAFIAGIILNSFYIYCQKNKLYTFWLVSLLHASYNLYGFLFVN